MSSEINETLEEQEMTETLKDWMKEHWPDEDKWVYGAPAQYQIRWVRNSFAYMVWNSLLLEGVDIETREATMTVPSTHRSKSVTLPVYQFDVGGVVLKVRGNFHDWCVRCWSPLQKPFPEWMHVDFNYGGFEGMEHEDSPVAFCVSDQDRLYATVWWMLCEGIQKPSK